MPGPTRVICWTPSRNKGREGVGLEHLLLAEGTADSVILGFDEVRGPFRLSYRLDWDETWRLQRADLVVVTASSVRALRVQSDGMGHWRYAGGAAIAELDGCVDIDIWPTPFTNSFPIRREAMEIGERREFRVAWINGPALTFQAQPQAYTRLADRQYRFENLDGDDFQATLTVDDEGIVIEYPGLFRRVPDWPSR